MPRPNETVRSARRERVGLLVLSQLYAADENGWAWDERAPWLQRTIESLSAEGWRADLILLTGDLTARARPQDFEFLRWRLDLLRSELSRGGATPVVVAVPGPSDVVAGPDTDPAARILAEDWAIQSEIQSEFRRSPSCLWRRVATAGFSEFSTWWNAITQAQPSVQLDPGVVPGEGVVTLSINGLRVGVACLNTALQHLGGHRPERVAMDRWRMEDLREKAAAQDLTIALMHHPFSAFEDEALHALMGEAPSMMVSSRAPRAAEAPPRWVTAPPLAEAIERGESVRNEVPEGLLAITLDVGARDAWAEVRARYVEAPPETWHFEVPRRGEGFAEPAPEETPPSERVVDVALEHFRGRQGAESLARAALSHRGELEDFVHENFPRVHEQYWERIPYDAGIRLLVESEEPAKVVRTLADTFPSTVRSVIDKRVALGVKPPSVKLK